MTKILKSCLFSLSLALSSLAMSADSAVFLQYHHVSNTTPAVTSVTPERFSEHLNYLDDNGFTVKPLTKVINAIQQGENLPEKTVVITFDDAYRNIYTNAFPLLKEKGWPFTIFVSPGPVDKGFGSFLSWDQMREMSRHGATLANHSLNHDHLVERLAGESEELWLERVRKDLAQTESRIKEMTGQSVMMLAWPFGETTPELRQLIDDTGYVGFGQQSGAVGPLSDFTRLPRYPMAGNFSTMAQFRTKVNTKPLPLKQQHPDSALIDEDNLKPGLELTLASEGFQKNQLRCYASGQGEIAVEWLDEDKTRFITSVSNPLPVGRSRYNCTAPSIDGRTYYWYSHQWLRLTEDGKAID
ncbi:MAG: polysaccharide deacetylase family protein [Endozoicomonas sp.]